MGGKKGGEGGASKCARAEGAGASSRHHAGHTHSNNDTTMVKEWT